jgi:serine/threonine protein kinase, bacterial
MPLSSGADFAGFTIVRLLGAGGMGEVYLAQHPRLPRRDAIKVLPADFATDPDYRARFEREADLASTLWHPHIVGVHDRGKADGHLWLAMDFVDGLDAGQLLAQRYPAGMPVELVARIVSAIASALDYAHKRGLLHRDVKPANIMLGAGEGREQRILLTDFGIARNLGDISGLTATNMTVGTLAFSAPEQLMGDDMDGRADQYSLATTAYFLLTGTQLFPHSNPAAVISRHLSVAPPLLSATKPALVACDPVLARALAKDPGERFAGCTDFAEAFAHAAASGADTRPAWVAATQARTATPAEAAPAVPASVSGSRKRSRARVGLAVLAVCVLSIGAVVIILAQRSHTSPASITGQGLSTERSLMQPPAALPSPAQAPPPAPPLTNAATPPTRFAIPACYSIEDPPTERPTSVIFEYCGDGGTQLDHVAWTTWGPQGANAHGYFSVKSCVPDCAQGGMPSFPAEIHASNPVALPKSSGCPTDMQFYTDLTLAFPTSSPSGLNGQTINSEYDGYPAIQFSTRDGQPNTKSLGVPSCW